MSIMVRSSSVVAGLFCAVFLVGCKDEDDDASEKKGKKGGDGDSGEGETDSQGAIESGEYPNYFVEAGYSEEEVQEKIERAWKQLFYGDEENETVYFESGENDNGPYGYVLDVNSNDVRSEGMSYGMMFAVQLDDKAVFDSLWNWAKTFMWHGDESHPFYEYFSWNCETDGEPRDEGPAPDGEEYFAMALYFADARWGSESGIYNYLKEANRLVSAMKNREAISGKAYSSYGGSRMQTGVALFNPEEKMVRFSPNKGASSDWDFTDPSYHLPAFYELWALWGPEEDREFWSDAAQASRDFFQDAAHEETALTPNYSEFDGTPVTLDWNVNSGTFGADACRTVMNWSVDWAWFRKDERERALADKLQAFFAGLSGAQYNALYELDGTPLSDNENYYSPSVVAMNATSALAATDESLSKEFVRDLWFLGVPSGQYRYYDGMLYLFGLLHVSGQFKIYEPES